MALHYDHNVTRKTAYLIRHAQSRPSSKVAEPAWPLSKRGQEQATQLGPLLESLDIDRVYSSPYLRTLSTIDPFVKKLGLEVVVDPDLRERKITEGVRKDFPQLWMRSWKDFSFALPGCENSFDAQRRFVGAVSRIVSDETSPTIAISAHGNVIALMLNHVEPGYGWEEADRLRNPDVVKIDLTDTGLTWDRSFRLAGIDNIVTPHGDTPIDW